MYQKRMHLTRSHIYRVNHLNIGTHVEAVILRQLFQFSEKQPTVKAEIDLIYYTKVFQRKDGVSHAGKCAEGCMQQG